MDENNINGIPPLNPSGSGDGFGGGFLGGDSLGSYDSGSGYGQTGTGSQNDFGSLGSYDGGQNGGYGGSGYGQTGTGSQNDFGSLGSYDGGQNGGYGGSGYGQTGTGSQNDFGSLGSYDGSQNGGYGGSGYGQTGTGSQNDFGSLGSNDGGQDSGVGGSTFGGQNNGLGGSTFGGQDSGLGGSTFGGQDSGLGGSTFGGSSMNNAPQDNYDQNFMFSDPSSGYQSGSVGDPAFSSFNNVPRVTTASLPKSNKNTVIKVAIVLLAIAVGVAVYFYVTYGNRKSFKEWSETDDGKSFISRMQNIADTSYRSDEYTINVFVEGEDAFVIALNMTEYQNLSDEELELVTEYTKKTMKSQVSSIARDIKKVREHYKLKEFYLVYRMINADGQVMFDIPIRESDA